MTDYSCLRIRGLLVSAESVSYSKPTPYVHTLNYVYVQTIFLSMQLVSLTSYTIRLSLVL